MCGIAGTVNSKNTNIDRILESMYHRGPDSKGHFKDDNVVLIHSRLSIQDVNNGCQPFKIGEYVIIFNGEIYNHKKLRGKSTKYKYKTDSDTETLLALYIEFGISIFKEFDGMFAFAISDRKKNKIILGRDRTGKKPLYFQHKHNKLLFSSELNTMKILCNDLNIDNEEVYSYIRNGFFYSDTTPYINVKQVKPGHIYSFDLDTLKLSKNNYFKYIDYFKKEKVYDFDYARNKVDLLLHDSIKSRLIASDVEVGAFLSGGIDSSLIVAIASQYVDQLKTFTVRFEGGYDESYLANLTAQKYGTKHTVIDITMNLKDDIEKILLNLDSPL